MANKKVTKEEKKEKKGRRNQGSSCSNSMVAGGVFLVAVIVALPQLTRMPAGPPDTSLGFPTPPDARPPTCPRDVTVKDAQESVSIIIPYLNEEWFRIEATMQSLVKYTDMNLVLEVMWISDGNTPDKVFAEELKAIHPKVWIHENPTNLGLIYTKMQAASRAKGSVLMFLEPHVIMNVGWLEPLLSRLEEFPKALMMPNIDPVDSKMKYGIADPGHWRFEWNLNLIYTNPGNMTKRPDQPYMSPATSGGIYAIRKDFWDYLELFDPELVRWGGDHVEASHKVWRCGGMIEVHPCSRVGHWFREVEQRPYDVKVEAVVRNYKRLVEVWFDDMKELFYKVRPEAIPMDIGDVSEMVVRRQGLAQCKDMAWYVKNVDIELGWEADHACIPGADPALQKGGCGKDTKAAMFHSTVTKAISVKEYERLADTAEAFQIYKK